MVQFGAEAIQDVAEKEGYVTIETMNATYFVNQDLTGRYGQETFPRLFRLVDERFDEIMNITGWSSERFFGKKIEVTVDKLNEAGGSGSGGFGHVSVFLGTDFFSTNETLNTVDGFPSWVITAFLHEMTHGITPISIAARRWLAEGYSTFLSFEVQVKFEDRTRNEVDAWYNRSWEDYVNNGYLDFHHNTTIQDDQGTFITAWMLKNITDTYGWATQERFFASLPDDYLFYMPSFILSAAESSSYNYYLDSLLVGYYSLAAATSLYSSFKSWGVESLPNPITVIQLNGTREMNHTYTSAVSVSLSAAGENEISKIEYSFDQKNWHLYENPFSVSSSTSLYTKSTDNAGNTGAIASITLTLGSENAPPPEPFPILPVVAVVAISAALGAGLLVYSRKRNRKHHRLHLNVVLAVPFYSCCESNKKLRSDKQDLK
jgi:hypothetical protein